MSLTTRIKVDTVGTVRVTESRDEIFTSYGARYPHLVAFIPLQGETVTYTIESPILRPGHNPFDLYGTVHAALSFLADDEERDDNGTAMEAFPWQAMIEVPIGWADATSDTYRVIDDGHGGSDRTKGTQRHRRIKITQGYDESLTEAVTRCLGAWPGWEGAGTFDTPGDGARWYTVPVERGSLRVAHSVLFQGPVATRLPELAIGMINAGLMWGKLNA